MLPIHLPYLFQYLSQQVKQPARHLPGLTLRMPPLLAVCQVGFLNVQELRPRAVDPQPPASLAHQVVGLLDAFPQQLLICRIAHVALITGRIREHRVQILHVRLPCLRQAVLQILDLQLPRQLQRNVIPQLVVRQRMGRINHDVAEHLVKHVPVQRLHQFRKVHLRLHLQEHQRHFTLRSEIGLPASLRCHALVHKLQAFRHLSQREDLLHPSQFSLFNGPRYSS